MGVTQEDAELGADVLVATDLRGVETHGVSNMLRSYVQGYSQGSLNPRPDWRIVRESPSSPCTTPDTQAPSDTTRCSLPRPTWSA
jgi:LDH2 family malate/lactate/ureidoglycolate dehydrogenase